MKQYSIQGGEEGKTRLDILSSTIREHTKDFLVWGGLRKGIRCLDLGCGNGSVSALMAKQVGPEGNVLGLDLDPTNIAHANQLKQSDGIVNLMFQVADANQIEKGQQYDLVYSRFLLSHLKSPDLVLKKAFESLKEGGKILLEDTDFSGHFSFPANKAFDRYVSLYQQLLKKRGADANIGKKLPQLLLEAGFRDIEFKICQPAHMSGEGKHMAEITLAGIGESLFFEQLIGKEEFHRILEALIAFRKQTHSILSMPRIFQVKAKRIGQVA